VWKRITYLPSSQVWKRITYLPSSQVWKRITYLPSSQVWKSIGPCVVSAWKLGTMSPSLRVLPPDILF
jgi:hypothetical protein